MVRHKRGRKEQRAHCDELHDDDGIDPRTFFRADRIQDKENRKAKQLCRQVEEALTLILSGECDDEWLNCLRVMSVAPR